MCGWIKVKYKELVEEDTNLSKQLEQLKANIKKIHKKYNKKN